MLQKIKGRDSQQQFLLHLKYFKWNDEIFLAREYAK